MLQRQPVPFLLPYPTCFVRGGFTTTTDCDVTERPVMAIPMSVLPEIGGSLGRPDLAPDCDHTRDLRSTPGGQSRSPTCRHGPGAGDLAALPARGHTLA